MGQHFEFSCTHCGYRAEISGGNDSGMAVVTTTIFCRDCRRLYDVVIAELLEGGEWKKCTFCCPESVRHEFELWESGGPCPKCGNTLEKGGLSCLWD